MQTKRKSIHISVADQRLLLKQGNAILASYPVSTSRYGLGTEEGSMKTPTGRFRIAEKIGADAPVGTVFRARVPVDGAEEHPADADLITSRILWLDGLQDANANTFERYIYIHGTNHEAEIGQPASHGCIRMRNADLVELFDQVDVNTRVKIEA